MSVLGKNIIKETPRSTLLFLFLHDESGVNNMVQSQGAVELHWGISKLLELGISEELIKDLTENEIADLVKGLLYLKERYKEGL